MPLTIYFMIWIELWLFALCFIRKPIKLFSLLERNSPFIFPLSIEWKLISNIFINNKINEQFFNFVRSHACFTTSTSGSSNRPIYYLLLIIIHVLFHKYLSIFYLDTKPNIKHWSCCCFFALLVDITVLKLTSNANDCWAQTHTVANNSTNWLSILSQRNFLFAI